jgi:hypothetical protein
MFPTPCVSSTAAGAWEQLTSRTATREQAELSYSSFAGKSPFRFHAGIHFIPGSTGIVAKRAPSVKTPAATCPIPRKWAHHCGAGVTGARGEPRGAAQAQGASAHDGPRRSHFGQDGASAEAAERRDALECHRVIRHNAAALSSATMVCRMVLLEAMWRIMPKPAAATASSESHSMRYSPRPIRPVPNRLATARQRVGHDSATAAGPTVDHHGRRLIRNDQACARVQETLAAGVIALEISSRNARGSTRRTTAGAACARPSSACSTSEQGHGERAGRLDRAALRRFQGQGRD